MLPTADSPAAERIRTARLRSVQLDVLGPVRLRRDDVAVDLGTPRQRAIVAALALEHGRPLSADTLITRVWGDDPPATVTATLQSYIGQLRRALEPDRRPRQSATVLVTEAGGYALRVAPLARDDTALLSAVDRARPLLTVVPDPLRPAAPPAARNQVAQALEVLDAAVSRWRGIPYGELGDDPDAATERVRLAEHRTAAVELAVVARLALGRHREVAATLEELTRTQPLHERWWALWAVALTRSGRQADALAALQRLRSVLDDELGIEPGAPVRELQTAILRQDPTVGWLERPADGRPAARRFAATESAAEPPAPVPSAVAPAAWPLAGRTAELTRLLAALDRARGGRPVAVWVTGEAGIGKTRLVTELIGHARRRGFGVAAADCSRPAAAALWPWREILAAAGAAWPEAEPEPAATVHAVIRALSDAARRQPVLVLLEDVHEADRASLDLLRHLVGSLTDEPLLVVATRRSGTGDDETLTGVAAAIARRDGVRVDLTGLSPAEAQGLIAAATGSDWPLHRVAELTARCGGNPYFLVETARTGGAVTGSLTDVVAVRLAALPPATRTALAVIAVIGGAADPTVAALTLGVDRVRLAADLAPAVAAGMLVDPGTDGHVRFAHGVVAEVVLTELGAAAGSVWHGRIAATLDAHSPLRRIEDRADLARHWQSAGPEHAAAGWRSVLRAAEAAGREGAHREAADLLIRAVTLQEQDRDSTDDERHILLMLLADAQRWAGDWAALGRTVDLAMATAEQIGDHALAARTAVATIEGAIWQVRTFGVVHAPVIAALERILARLDADPDAISLQARARIALATELYYSTAQPRIDQLVDEAVALADSSGDPRLQSVVLAGAFSARWRADTLDWRAAVADRAVAVATSLGDARAQALAQTLRVCAALERGDLGLVRAELPSALALARHLGLVTAEVVLLAADIPLRAMAGDDVTAARELAEVTELAQRSRVPNFDRALAGTSALAALWAGDMAAIAALGEQVAAQDEDGVAMDHLGPWLLLRLGMADLARTTFPTVAVDLSGQSYPLLANACLACELGLGLGDADLAARGHRIAAPYAGRMAVAGSALALGPVDGFLAFGAAAAGDLAAAARHAEAGLALGTAWGLPRYVAWLTDVRTRYGF